MADDHQKDPPAPLPSFTSPPLPDFAQKKPGSFVPPRPPVLHPNVGSAGSSNPFAPKGVASNLEKSPLPKPTAPNFTPSMNPPQAARKTPSPKPVSSPIYPLIPPTKREEPAAVPKRSEEPPISVSSPHKEVPLTPSPPIISPPTSPAVLPTESPQTVEKAGKSSESEEKKPVPTGHVDMTGGLMGWITKTVTESKLLNDVAEKAKHGMEQVLTTLDPGMRGFLSDDGTVELYIVAPDANVIRAVKEGFERVFASVLVRAVPAALGNLPPLVNGSSYALELCRERSSRVFASKQVPTTAPLLVMQPFIMHFENKPYTSTRLLLEWKGNLLDAFSQLLPVEDKLLKVLEARSKADGKQAQDYSITLSQAVKEVYNLDCESWAGPPSPYSFSELLEHGAASLALQFMNLSMEKSAATTPTNE